MSLFEDPDVGAAAEPTLSVTELSDRIGNALRAAFREEVWVRGEIRNISRPRSGHVYFTLVEPHDGESLGNTGASVAVMLSRTNKASVNTTLREAGGGVRMSDGTEVRVRGRVEYYSGRGQVQLLMTAIDPAYTLGQLELARAAVLGRLTEEGLLRANAAHALALVPLRVALITSVGSAAEADFLHELEHSGYAFSVLRLDARVQGLEAPLELVAALAEAGAAEVDAVALVRGGGARTDLLAFEDERVARAIAACPLPVLTGIGHEVDRSVADEVAHTAHKTPTACAQALVDRVREFDARLELVWDAIAGCARRDVEGQAELVGHLAGRIDRAARGGLDTALRRLDGHGGRVSGAARSHLRAAGTRADEAARRLRHRAPRVVADAQRRLDGVEARVRANDPDRTLARGWSITRTADGRVVRGADDVTPGDELRTQVAAGEVRSTVVATTSAATSTVDGDG
jgi:exodeoxyribonuclease VII large subunit